MNNLSSYSGLVDAKIRVSDKDSPVHCIALGIGPFKNYPDDIQFENFMPSKLGTYCVSPISNMS